MLSPPDASPGQFGTAVASAGDVDGDGFGDLLVGAPCPLDVADSATCQNRAFLFRGGPDGPSTTPSSILTGPSDPVAQFGVGVAGAGDVNGDGYADVVVMDSPCRFDPQPSCVLARAFVFQGGPGGLASAPSASLVGTDDSSDKPNMGGVYSSSLAAAGDVNGDGYADLLLARGGAPDGAAARAP